jgi:N6-adenosine-specific RNA methylase IME4
VRYRTIVADPPWDHSDGTGRTYGKQAKDLTPLPYGVLSVDEIAALRVHEWVERDAHLYLWTTQRFLEASFAVARAWGFRVSQTLVWCKQPIGFFGRPFCGSSVEFCHYAVKGSLSAHGSIRGRWFTWPRGQHSAKPEAFLDLVESVSPGPYLELFARRNRLGWHTWGNEALNHIELATK